jgi:hypothetical protein
MKGTVKWSFFGLLLLAVLLFAAHGIGLVNLRFWGPQFQEARREIFEETQSFVHGKITHLNRLRLEYESTELDTRRKALRTMILQEAAVLEEENLPTDLRSFIQSLRGYTQ